MIHNADVERAVIGACLLSEPAAQDVVAALTAEDFATIVWRDAFMAIRAMVTDGLVPDPLTVTAKMGADKTHALAVLDAQGYGSPTSLPSHLSLLSDLAMRRRLERGVAEITLAIREADDPYQTAIRSLEACEHTSSEALGIPALIEATLARHGEKRETVSLAQWGCRLRFGELALIAARPGVGKSAFAGQLAHEWASRHLKCRVYSYEMDPADWTTRYMASIAGVPLEVLEDGVDEDAVTWIRTRLDGDWQSNLSLADCARMTLDSLIADMRRFSRKGGRVAIVDYLQLTVPQTYEDVTESSRRLKLCALETGLLIVAVSQLSRSSAREDGTLRSPALSDLRQSGALEQDADAVLLLHRYSARETETSSKLMEHFKKLGYLVEEFPGRVLGHMEVAKMRRGPTFLKPAFFDGSEYRWTPVEQLEDGRWS